MPPRPTRSRCREKHLLLCRSPSCPFLPSFLKERPNSDRRADVAKTGDLSPHATRSEVYDRASGGGGRAGVSESEYADLSAFLTYRA